MFATGERRRRVRLILRWPLRLSRAGDTDMIETETENLSSEGFYCVTSRPFDVGERLECILGLPALDLGYHEDPVSLHGLVRIVRVEVDRPGSGYGLGCRLENLSLIFEKQM